MKNSPDNLDTASEKRVLGRSSALECRECRVLCEVVVSPWRCLKERQKCVYAFKGEEGTYFGCLYKVFAPEFDLETFEGSSRGNERRGDPYGPVRMTGKPRPQCPIGIERAYLVGSEGSCCTNPTFLREAFRVAPAGGSDLGR